MVLPVRTIQTRCDFIHFSETSPTVYSVGKPALKLVGGSKRTRGNSSLRIAPPLAAKHARIAPHPARETTSRRDQMKLPLSASGMPGLPPGMISLVASAVKTHLPDTKGGGGQADWRRLRQIVAR